MTMQQAYDQYKAEVARYERWGETNIVSFTEWCEIKGITSFEQEED